MKRRKRIVAFIPARGGSRSIPLKNIALIGGKPLIYWVARACSRSSIVSEVCVATENDEIRACVEAMVLDRVKVVDRNMQTATDEASTESALLEFAQGKEFDHVVLVQATSPLLTSADIDGAVEAFTEGGYDSLLTVVRTKRFLWKEIKENVVPENYDPSHRPRRQEWKGQLVENGALYVTSRRRLLESGSRLSGRIGAYEMSAETYFELDEPDDWRYVDHVLRSRLRTDGVPASVARGIKLFCVDVDGTLTDGGMYYAETGELMKKFNTRDALGMRLLREQGIDVAIITAEDSAIVRSRARKLQIDSVYLGVKDKEAFVEDLLKQRGIDWEEVTYVGDDVNDLDVLRRAGLSACPHDASTEVRALSQYVCRQPGGRGAVREVCDLILSMRNPAKR
jgi:N-acylneuraminate cytidylyltransferase